MFFSFPQVAVASEVMASSSPPPMLDLAVAPWLLKLLFGELLRFHGYGGQGELAAEEGKTCWLKKEIVSLRRWEWLWFCELEDGRSVREKNKG